MSPSILRAAFVLVLALPAAAQEPVATFSIVAFDPASGDLGVAVASRVLAVGSVVPWARAGVGAVATQAWADPAFGPRGLDLLASGKSPEEALDALLAGDPRREERQVAIVDAQGRVARFTGAECHPWAGSRSGAGWSAQGNLLESEAVARAMGEAFEREPGALAVRLLAALEAGEAAGGDRRGKQSAAILVVRAGGGYDGKNDRYLDLRVDDHAAPVAELRRLVGIALSRRLLGEAESALEAGKPDEARQRVEDAARLAPADGLVLFFLARLEAAAGKADLALAALEEALAARPDLRRYLEHEPAFEGLKKDERFVRLMRGE